MDCTICTFKLGDPGLFDPDEDSVPDKQQVEEKTRAAVGSHNLASVTAAAAASPECPKDEAGSIDNKWAELLHCGYEYWRGKE